jgi:hypothetical protein
VKSKTKVLKIWPWLNLSPLSNGARIFEIRRRERGQIPL